MKIGPCVWSRMKQLKLCLLLSICVCICVKSIAPIEIWIIKGCFHAPEWVCVRPPYAVNRITPCSDSMCKTLCKRRHSILWLYACRYAVMETPSTHTRTNMHTHTDKRRNRFKHASKYKTTTFPIHRAWPCCAQSVTCHQSTAGTCNLAQTITSMFCDLLVVGVCKSREHGPQGDTTVMDTW